MQVLIDIDDEDYKDITLAGENTINLGVLLDLREAVRNGITLPKGHGNLFDERDIIYGNYEIIGGRIYELDPIIKADRSEKE